MTKRKNFLALDMGAESGRVMLGTFDGAAITMAESHRFDSAPVRTPDGLHTDVLRIFSELKRGMAIAAKGAAGSIDGVGVDTWGVDFALLDKKGALLANPYQYRDTMTDGILPKAFRIVPKKKIFARTGLQFMSINTLYQLYALKLRGSPVLDIADRLLMTPDLFNYWLCGKKVNEFSIATTSQCFDPVKNAWAKTMIAKFGIPTRLFGAVVRPGTVIGRMLPQVCEEIGAKGDVAVIAPGCHDTTLAVAAVPAQNRDFAFLSCGTWSLMGAELPKPCINEKSLAADFTNEGGVSGTFRFLKNLTGLWILQECRRAWEKEGQSLGYGRLTAMASEAPALRSLIDTTAAEFARPGDMPEKIREYCRRTGQHVPDSEGAIVRCALESLALIYKKTLGQLETILGKRLDPIHMVGGGTQNKLLCQFAADATGRRVVAGPVEATAIGNVMMQAMALGLIKSLDEGRDIVSRSFPTVTYEPAGGPAWTDAYARFANRLPGKAYPLPKKKGP
jgi:rhamnulokinase